MLHSGKLTADVRSDSQQLETQIEEIDGGRIWRLSFNPTASDTQYTLGVWWTGYPLPLFPLRFSTSDTVAEAAERHNVILFGRGLSEAKCDIDAEFIIDASQTTSTFEFTLLHTAYVYSIVITLHAYHFHVISNLIFIAT